MHRRRGRRLAWYCPLLLLFCIDHPKRFSARGPGPGLSGAFRRRCAVSLSLFFSTCPLLLLCVRIGRNEEKVEAGAGAREGKQLPRSRGGDVFLVSRRNRSESQSLREQEAIAQNGVQIRNVFTK